LILETNLFKERSYSLVFWIILNNVDHVVVFLSMFGT